MNQDIKVLVVDDDPESLFAMTRNLRSVGYRVFEATTGDEGLRTARIERPDLILLDVMLPDADGMVLCSQIKADPDFDGTFVVLASGKKITSMDQADGLILGADGYILKPISNDEFIARVNAFVRIIRSEKERNRVIIDLQEALAKIKTLSGLLPICSYCKNIRDDVGYWNKIETYIKEHTLAEFSHGICPECAKKYFPDFDVYEEGGGK